jgi:hypothetical protein
MQYPILLDPSSARSTRRRARRFTRMGGRS